MRFIFLRFYLQDLKVGIYMTVLPGRNQYYIIWNWGRAIFFRYFFSEKFSVAKPSRFLVPPWQSPATNPPKKIISAQPPLLISPQQKPSCFFEPSWRSPASIHPHKIHLCATSFTHFSAAKTFVPPWQSLAPIFFHKKSSLRNLLYSFLRGKTLQSLHKLLRRHPCYIFKSNMEGVVSYKTNFFR